MLLLANRCGLKGHFFCANFNLPVEGERMKSFTWQQLAVIGAVSLVAIYASNNEVPILGDKLKKAMSGGTGWL
ncbi:MAG: hypothetical protein CMQ34_09805 [Gammaproteobacteria bacterium]|nr:hypothetical protein [Gammaproteobacteria bacterium]|tara:strand:+ start:594 stop:812 length:219 start_codon:yes stop_codon:yes gene_type:complete